MTRGGPKNRPLLDKGFGWFLQSGRELVLSALLMQNSLRLENRYQGVPFLPVADELIQINNSTKNK